jgi:hypothetical protein
MTEGCVAELGELAGIGHAAEELAFGEVLAVGVAARLTRQVLGRPEVP